MGHMGNILMEAVMRAAMDFENLNNLLEHTVYVCSNKLLRFSKSIAARMTESIEILPM